MFIEKVIGDLGEKRRWWSYKTRVKQLAEPYRTVAAAFERYLMYSGAGGGSMSLFEDLTELFEQSAADRTPIRDVVGDDPVEFIEAFARNYEEESWRNRERTRLLNAIEQAAGEGK
ncbi:DUF1048 domain-containing protein [Nocardia aurantia]|uniref:DUF1048 domain-containing protein n=1 Tax=Nocardia aurantia TaxID=2585199 RepID=A0A7K0DZ03_9NOCA|nr:DUF1048 domain-containing protein [Nocardia aurantia]MQY30512.1 hypothetical protein [Nocardia aurantia]